MAGTFYRPDCICEDKKKCKCGAKWAYIVDIGVNPKTGRRMQKKRRGFKTKGEAQREAAKVALEVDQGSFIIESELTLNDFVKEWLILYANSGKVKESTVRVRKHESNRLTADLGFHKIKSITRTQYQSVLIKLKEQGLSCKTIEGAHVTGGMIFKKAIELGYIKNDPTKFAVVPKTAKTVEEIEAEEERAKYLEKTDLSLFLKTAKEKGMDKDYTVFLLLAYTGMRAGELCALKWKDIDLANHTVNITKTYYNPTNNIKEYKLLTPKTKTSKRKIAVDGTVIEELKKHKAKQNIVRMKNKDTYYEGDFVFTKETEYLGYPEIIKTIEYRMRRLLKLSGLPTSLTPHSLRHTHTSLLAEAGASLPEIMERLGHKDDETTKSVYLHVTEATKKETSQKFSELMKSL